MRCEGYHFSIQPRLFIFPSIQGEQIGKPCRVHNSGSYGWSRRQIAKHGTFCRRLRRLSLRNLLSALSFVEWNPVSGAIPPLGKAEAQI